MFEANLRICTLPVCNRNSFSLSSKVGQLIACPTIYCSPYKKEGLFCCCFLAGFTFISVVSSMKRNIRHLGMLPIGGIDHIIYVLSEAQDLDPLTELN